MHHMKLCNIPGYLSYGDVGKHFSLSGGRWVLKGDHVKSTKVLSSWMRVLPYSSSRVSAFCILFFVEGWGDSRRLSAPQSFD